jgi:hypothetical protein
MLTTQRHLGVDGDQLSEYDLPRHPSRGHLQMKRSLYFWALSLVILMIFSAASFGAENSPVAMLYARGETTLNGNSVPRSSALFSGDLIRTSADSVANINATGTTVLILNESLVQYAGNAVTLEHGGVRVSTSKLIATRAGAVTVTPVANNWTEFEVRDVDGTVHVAARKGDLTISDGSRTTTLAQGQETTRDDTQAQTGNGKKKEKGAGGTVPGASAGIMNSPVTIGIGAAAIVGGTAWVLIQSDNPVSPAKP